MAKAREVPCAFVFKDSRCRYVGAYVSCDKAFRDCQDRGNEANFGGFLDPSPMLGTDELGTPLTRQDG